MFIRKAKKRGDFHQTSDPAVALSQRKAFLQTPNGEDTVTLSEASNSLLIAYAVILTVFEEPAKEV